MPSCDETEASDNTREARVTTMMEVVERQYRNLCVELNLDTETTEEAWRAFLTTKTNFTLEGDQLHWLACALYVACRKGTVPTVGHQGVHQAITITIQ